MFKESSTPEDHVEHLTFVFQEFCDRVRVPPLQRLSLPTRSDAEKGLQGPTFREGKVAFPLEDHRNVEVGADVEQGWGVSKSFHDPRPWGSGVDKVNAFLENSKGLHRIKDDIAHERCPLSDAASHNIARIARDAVHVFAVLEEDTDGVDGRQ